MSISNILSLISGLAFFLYGMKIMGDGLEKVAGDKMSQIIDSVTGNLFKGVLVGAGDGYYSKFECNHRYGCRFYQCRTYDA